MSHDSYDGDAISDSEWAAADRESMERDADREMVDNDVDFGLEDIGCK